MRKLSKTTLLVIAFVVSFSGQFIAQQNFDWTIIYKSEEFKKMHTSPVNLGDLSRMEQKQDSLYKIYKSKKGKLPKTLTEPNWREFMSTPENQMLEPGIGNSCFAHTATGVVEGQLQILKGSKMGENGIDLNEYDYPGACCGGMPSQVLHYMLGACPRI